MNNPNHPADDTARRLVAELRLQEALEALRDSEARWKFALEGAGDGVWDWDIPRGTVVYSRVWKRMLGYGEEELGSSIEEWRSRVHPADLPSVTTALEAYFRGETDGYSSEHRLRTKSGAWVWVLDRGRVITSDPAGKPVRMIGTHSDITARKEADRREQSRNRAMERIASGAPLGVILEGIVQDLEGENPRMLCSILLLDHAGQNLLLGAAPSLPRFYNEAIDGFAIGPMRGSCGTAAFLGERVVVEDIRQDPKWIDFRDLAIQAGLGACWSEPVKSADGRVLGTFAIYHREPQRPNEADIKLITDAARFAALAIERREADEALRKSEERLKLTFDAVAEGLVVQLDDGTIIQSNAAARRILGLTQEQIEGRGSVDPMWRTIHEDRSPFPGREHPAMLALRTGEPVRDVVMGVYRPDEELVWISINAEPLRDDRGRVVMVVCSFSDITHRKELEDRLRQAQKMEVIGQLAGGVAHDFNNILATMMLNLEMLRMEQGLPAAAEGPLAEFENAARRGANLTQQLLSFSRQQAMQPVLMDVNKALANLVLMLSRLLGEHIHIDLISNSSELWVEADAAMLDQVVMNLCVNARDAMPKGGTLTIEAAAADVGVEEARKSHDGRPGRFVRIQVQDTGTGMEPSVLAHLFEPFFTTKEVGKGTGLGLASVHGIIHQHKGWVAVESTLGLGSTFKVYLPRAAKPGTPIAPPPVHLVREGANEMVLLVEDEAALRRVSQKMLVRLGYRVLEAGDGPEAMKVWSAHAGEVDLLLTDMMMPGGMTGLDLAAKLRGERPGLKVIIMSGYSAQIVGSGSLRNAGVDFLPKPYHLEALSVALRQALAPAPTTQ